MATNARLDDWFKGLGTNVTATLLAVLVTGCAADSDSGPTPDPGDTDAPLIVSTIPTHGSTGAGAATKIHITFSEPMDPATVMGSYASEKLPLDKVSTQWNADQTVLSISPDTALLYADGVGNDPSTQARYSYAITIGAEAADLLGNKLGTAYQLGFSTKLRMSTTAPLVDDLSATTKDGVTIGGPSIVVGDAASDNLAYTGYVTFGLGALPQDIMIESAELAVNQVDTEGAPYGLLGALKVYHLSYMTMADVGSALAISAPGNLSEDGDLEVKTIGTTSQVANDIANRQARGDHSQYRLQFDTVAANDENDRVVLSKQTFAMSIVYIAD